MGYLNEISFIFGDWLGMFVLLAFVLFVGFVVHKDGKL
jgi:hypothetical protein